jgi:hypothetical protein
MHRTNSRSFIVNNHDINMLHTNQDNIQLLIANADADPFLPFAEIIIPPKRNSAC